MKHTCRAFLTGSAALAMAAATMAVPAAASGSFTVTPVVTGLNSPRGLAFDGEGGMYVAQSGRADPDKGFTNSGQVSKYAGLGFRQVWSKAFTSLHDSEHGAPEALGPEGISAVGNGCMGNSHGERNGCQVRMIMSESHAGTSDPTGQLGHLFRLDGMTGQATDISDVGDQQYQWTA